MSATRSQLDASLLQLLHQRVDACFVQAEARLGRSFPRPQIHCNMRGRAAGSARLQTWELRFNPALYEANQQAFLAEVVPHEVAHLLVYALWGEGRGKSRVLPHGRQWQSVMRELFALAPNTTHSFDLAVLAQRTHAGLLSEDLSLGDNELWGNYPQTYSLVGIINCAVMLSRSWTDVR